ncbi:hypothetical protein ACEZCY_11750 [Streptacidiphilus sp. N1-12]|uniref:non-specific serine/threonine protein kinase n=2 Tax=Streptacidiphilus alkalitolerans TaxID=3342712 RepID=A0ABV6V5S5_9ACTN
MAGGRVLGGRYLLSGRARGSGVAAVDQRSGAEVQLDPVPLPELVGPEDQVPDPFGRPEPPAPPRPDSTTARALTLAAFVAETVPDHPRLSQVFQVLDEGGYLWVVGEAVPGVTLRTLLERGGPLSPYRAAEMAYDLVTALRAVHAAGLVHGNVTPDTVLVCDDGTALLGGLVAGVAQEALCGGPGADQPGAGMPGGPWAPVRIRARNARAVIVGAVAERWAPEQVGPPPFDAPPAYGAPGSAPGAAGGGPPAVPVAAPVGPEADVWALGVLLYRAVTGDSPVQTLDGEPRDAEELFAAVRAGRYGRPQVAALLPRGTARAQPPPELPECGPLGPLVKRLLRVDPAARPGLPELAEEIRQLLKRAPEPINQDELLSVASLLPVDRDHRRNRRERGGEVLPHPDFPHHRHAAPHRNPALLGAILVSGIILFVLLALVLVVSVSR